MAVGGIGCFGLFFLWPVAALFVRLLTPKTSVSCSAKRPARIDILLPAFNEQAHIGVTLKSIVASIDHLRTADPGAPVLSICVGADGCTDDTVKIARTYAGVQVLESPVNASKWVTLHRLIADSKADWVVLVDAGTVWPVSWLTELCAAIQSEPRAMGVAPSYRPLRGGILASSLWRIEKLLKSLEAKAGGPVSLHGATVAYKADDLRNALTFLGSTAWLNDDVAIPLTLRSLAPERVILYPVGQVGDAGAQNDVIDTGRRKRMLLGNLQWVPRLLPACFRKNPVAGMIALRRVFRMFWAYWVGCLGLGLALAVHGLLVPAVAAMVILWGMSGSVRQVAGAALVSLMAPFYLAVAGQRREGVWK